VASVSCKEEELPAIQETLQTFPAVQGAITFDGGKARYCVSLAGFEGTEARILIERIRDTIDLVLTQLRTGR
jgi:hypothetical protein